MANDERLEELAGRMRDMLEEITDILNEMRWPEESDCGGVWGRLYYGVKEFDEWVQERKIPIVPRDEMLLLPPPERKNPAEAGLSGVRRIHE